MPVPDTACGESHAHAGGTPAADPGLGGVRVAFLVAHVHTRTAQSAQSTIVALLGRSELRVYNNPAGL